MAHIYHVTCPKGAVEGVSRFISKPRPVQDVMLNTQTFCCEKCGDTLHIDTDWEDKEGGFIGAAVEKNSL